MSPYRTAFWLNALLFLLLLILIGAAKLEGASAKELFLHPLVYPHISTSALTRLFQILCAVPPTLCFFTYSLLPGKTIGSIEKRFIICSALITSGFLINEIYRIHIYLSIIGFHKSLTILTCAIALSLYVIGFRRQLRLTPYPLLLASLVLLWFGISIDLRHIPNSDLSDFLEGIPKLLSQVHLSLYFWCTCQQILQRAAKLTALNQNASQPEDIKLF